MNLVTIAELLNGLSGVVSRLKDTVGLLADGAVMAGSVQLTETQRASLEERVRADWAVVQSISVQLQAEIV